MSVTIIQKRMASMRSYLFFILIKFADQQWSTRLPSLYLKMRAGIIPVGANSPDYGLGTRFLGLPKGRDVKALFLVTAGGTLVMTIQSGRAGGSGL
jgi:hypothetical protein